MSSVSVDWKKTATELRARVKRLHRSVLEKAVLRDSLPLRAPTLAGRSAAPEACAREQKFREVSPTYAEALVDDVSTAESVREITLDSLTWWVPLVQPDDPVRVERALRQQDFPYRAILQTRELAIGGVMLDIGANIGRMCVPRVILGDVTVAYCAEPDPLNHLCLTRNVRDNHLRGLVLPDRVALGAASGTARFRRSMSAGGHRVVGESAKVSADTMTVPVVALDDWVARLGVDLDGVTFVKLDVQGAEPRVLQGATRVLARRHIAWQIEIDPHLLDVGGSSAAELMAQVQQHFPHFIDLNRNASGERVRPVAELPEALAYVDGTREKHTDIVAFTLAGRSGD